MAERDSTSVLIDKSKAGDTAAFGEVFQRYRFRLSGLIDARMGSGVRRQLEVDDILQETFTRAFESLDRFDWRGDASFIRWLGAIAENLILKYAKKQRRAPKLCLNRDIPGSDTSPSTALRRDERFERLQTVLDELTPEQREVIRLLRIEGLKIKEAASRMQKSPEAVTQLMLRGLRRLRSQISESGSARLPDRPLDFGGNGDARR